MNINQTLKQYFGYDSLRTGQEELIDGILQGKDVLGIMPTGAGKSLCYQLPALLLEGITIVISPLISLMSDQVKTLNQAGVHAAYINSSLTENQIRTALSYASQGRYKIIYVAPERLHDPVTVVTGFDRPNLFFRVVTRKGGRETNNSILNYVKKHEDESGIIYGATKKNVDNLYMLLQQYGILAGRYHAGMSLDERKQSQEDFTYDRIRVMVATNAFGMGIDKSNIRYVLHYNMPQSLEYYYQEAGRAGRDGEEAECVLFFSKQDIIINKNLLQNKSSSFEGADYSLRMADNQRKLNRMIDYCETDECLRGFILSYFGDSSPCMCKKCSNCVVVEDEEEEIYIQSGKRRKKESRISGLSEVGQELFEKLRDCRTKLASDESVPPFIICSDKTLKDMCIKCPGNLLQMADIYGMGEKKIQSYGEDFIKVIKEFVAEKQILDAGTTSTVESDPMLKKSKEKLPFYIEPEKLDMIELKDQCNVSDLSKSINALCEENKERKNLTARFVNELLVNEGYLEETSDGGKKGKHVTKKGKNIGMEEEEREADDGRRYYAIIHTKQSQQMIIELLKKYYSNN